MDDLISGSSTGQKWPNGWSKILKNPKNKICDFFFAIQTSKSNPFFRSPFKTLGSEPDSAVPFNPIATALGVSGTLGALGVGGGPAVLGALGAEASV